MCKDRSQGGQLRLKAQTDDLLAVAAALVDNVGRKQEGIYPPLVSSIVPTADLDEYMRLAPALIVDSIDLEDMAQILLI